MNFKDILSRITGFSFPIVGLSWNPPETELKVARRIISHLEDKRVLSDKYSHREDIGDCIKSVINIREFLTEEIGKFENGNKELEGQLRAMRAACRKFLDAEGHYPRVERGQKIYYSSTPEFERALGELRGAFGIYLAEVAARYHLDIEGRLVDILPVVDKLEE